MRLHIVSMLMIYGFILISALMAFPSVDLEFQKGMVQGLTVETRVLDVLCTKIFCLNT